MKTKKVKTHFVFAFWPGVSVGSSLNLQAFFFPQRQQFFSNDKSQINKFVTAFFRENKTN
jgi:hypothetical protein